MSTSLPRLTIASVGSSHDAAARFAARLALAARDAGLRAVAFTVGADRDAPSVDALNDLARATGATVHRLDTELIPAPSMQSTVCRVADGADLVLVVTGELLGPGNAGLGRVFDAVLGLSSPLVVFADAEESARPPLSAAASAVAEEVARAIGADRPAPILALAERPGPRRAPAIERASGLAVVEVADAESPVPAEAVERLMDFARRCPPLPPPPLHRRRHVRARIGVVIDECFDLYDEEGLVQFEVAGAELVPVSALENAALPELDGLIVGDGRVERHSARLAEASRFRASVRALVEAGVPTLASGGGLAYLARGLRTLSGTLHPFAGVLDAEAVALNERLPRGHVEIESTVETLIGPSGTRVAGYVQRGWLLRGLPAEERGAYRTVRGTRDEGAARAALLGLHMRPYWPSSPRAGLFFVDRCVAHAVVRDRDGAKAGDEPNAT